MHRTCLFVLYRYIYSTYIIKLFLGGLYLDFLLLNVNNNALTQFLKHWYIDNVCEETFKLEEVTTNSI